MVGVLGAVWVVMALELRVRVNCDAGALRVITVAACPGGGSWEPWVERIVRE